MAEEQPDEVKAEARKFMSEMLSSTPEPEAEAAGKTIDMAAWKATYGSKKDDSAAITADFWSIYDPNATSIWKMVYDETDSTESLDEAIEIAKALIQKTQESDEVMKEHCFAVVHTLENLDIEGLWFINGPDPEELFGANEDTSWFTFSQLGPAATEQVQTAVSNLLAPTDGKLNGKVIKDTQVY